MKEREGRGEEGSRERENERSRDRENTERSEVKSEIDEPRRISVAVLRQAIILFAPMKLNVSELEIDSILEVSVMNVERDGEGRMRSEEEEVSIGCVEREWIKGRGGEGRD